MNNDRKVVLYVAASLDGYIAKDDDSLDWLYNSEGEGDNGYSEFYSTVDTILIGRKTYDQILILVDGDFPYKNKQCYVFSNSTIGKNENVEFVNEDIVTFTNNLKKQEGNDIWIVGGGDLLHSFIKERLVDEFIITVAPTLIGKGIPLFKETDFETRLSLIDIKQFNQFAQLHYEVR